VYNVLAMVRAAQIAAVGIALLLVLSAAGYGIARGFTEAANKSTAPPPGFRDIALQGKDASWFIFVPGSTVPKGTVPKLWVFKSPLLGEKRVTVLIQVDAPDGRTVSSINSNFAAGKGLSILMVDNPLNESGRYVVRVFGLSESKGERGIKLAEGDFTVTD